jgi:peptidoglycan/xylan/chitin deacetylase (PgdA/CDA1 family)
MRFIVALSVCIVAGGSIAAYAETCPGNPDALGTSRVLTTNPGEFTLLGTIQYKQTLPLKDHEVVITFDDGPLPPYTDIILETLASQCVKATYFLVGQMAHAYPSVVRRIYNEGHTIGTHSEHHPRAFDRLSIRRVQREVDGGINSVTGALGDAKALSPFFRVPGFGRTNAIERFLEDKQLVTWSADVDTDDWWRGSTPEAIVQRAMRRLNAKGRGIILMHDIHRKTAMALPILLKELKANGYNVVHVVAAGERPKSIPELTASPTSDGKALPTELTNTSSGDHALTARQNHRIKKRSASRHYPAHSYYPSGLSEDRMSALGHRWIFP